MPQSASCTAPKPTIVNAGQRRAAVARARERRVVLPTFSNLADPATIAAEVRARLHDVDPNAPRAENLWRVNWYNGPDRTRWTDHPAHVVLPEALTGVKAPIVVLLGARFPMIGAHKVLPAYALLACRASSPGSSIRRATARSGRRPEIIAAAASRSPHRSAAAAWRCCPPA